MSFARRRVSKGRLILGLFGFLIIAAASFLITRANFANAALAELNPDDWTLELVFFDDDVNNGKDPLTNFQWTIEDSTPEDRFTKVIRMQINYRNENVDRTYEPGELQIVVDNPVYKMFWNCTDFTSCLDSFGSRLVIGANYGEQTEFDWNLVYQPSMTHSQRFVFENNVPIEINSNTEGSIQLTFQLVSADTAKEFDNEHTTTFDYVGWSNEPYFLAKMNGNVLSNQVTFHYSRHVTHNWERLTYNINKRAERLYSYDLLGENPDDYIWVRYVFYGASNELTEPNEYGDQYALARFSDPSSYSDGHYYIGLKDYRVVDKFPDGVKVLDLDGNAIERDNDGYINITEYGTEIDTSTYRYPCDEWVQSCQEIVVGYPRSVYDDGSGVLSIDNTVELYGTYGDRDEEEKLAEKTINVNLTEFDFEYTPGNSILSKRFCGDDPGNYCYPIKKYYYQDIIDENGSEGAFMITSGTYYDGRVYDYVIGDDLLYYVDENNNSGILSDDDYYISSVISIGAPKNANGSYLGFMKYKPVLYVRRSGSTEYEEYRRFDYLGFTVNFTEEDHVQAWYVKIDNLDESILDFSIRTGVVLKGENYAKNGMLYNFSYQKILSGDTLLNPSTIDNYNNDITRDVIAAYDMEHYGAYLFRSTSMTDWSYHTIGNMSHEIDVEKKASTSVPYDPTTEQFNGSFTLGSKITDNAANGGFAKPQNNAEQIPEGDWTRAIYYYDLLPFGMEAGSEQDIQNSAGEDVCRHDLYYGKDGEYLFSTKSECTEYTKAHTSVSVTKNWHNTGRTHIKIVINYSEKPFSTLDNPAYTSELPSVKIYYSVPLDSYIEIGKSYTNRVYMTTDNATNYKYYRKVKDTGEKDAQEADIDDDGDTEEYFVVGGASISLLSATSSRQDIQTSVLTNHNGKYDTDPALSGYNEDYSYKLRVRTGPNRVTNLVLYEHLEEEYGTNEHWQGNFGGINTEYAETRLDYYDNPVQIKVYWSEKSDAGSLKTDTSWQAYDEDATDKTKVRSIAFEYLDQEGNPAILPQSFYTYVIVDMKAPDGENIMSLAYNNSHSEWNAIDNLTGELIYNITGIESNVVVVFLSETFDLTVKKEWSDYNNHYGIRPDTITFNLLKGSDVVDTKELNVANGETQVVFSGLSTPDQSLYSVQEVAIDEYQSSSVKNDINVMTFTNTITRDDPGTGGDPDPDPDPDPTGDDVLPKTNDNIRTFFLGGAIAIAVSATGFVVIRRRR